jgi:hypothetical protein
MPAKAKFYKAKVAFEIPKSYRRKTNNIYIGHKEIPDDLAERLMNLGDSEFVSEDICNPDLIIFDLDSPANQIPEMEEKINKVLTDWLAEKKR